MAEITACEIWQSEPGECLIGEYTAFQEVEHPKYGKQWQIFLKDESGNSTAVFAKIR
jgi:hypothetical protein